jgi:hypothetical protein
VSDHAKLSCSPGYIPFFQAIQPQMNSLKSFLNLNQSPSSLSSSGTLPPRPPSAGGRVSSSRKNSPAANVNSSTPLSAVGVHRSTAAGDKPKLFAKQLSLPSDVVGGETTVVANNAGGYVDVAGPAASIRASGSTREDEEDTRSVTSDILPEGQDEQAGCSLQ